MVGYRTAHFLVFQPVVACLDPSPLPFLFFVCSFENGGVPCRRVNTAGWWNIDHVDASWPPSFVCVLPADFFLFSRAGEHCGVPSRDRSRPRVRPPAVRPDDRRRKRQARQGAIDTRVPGSIPVSSVCASSVFAAKYPDPHRVKVNRAPPARRSFPAFTETSIDGSLRIDAGVVSVDDA